MTEVTTEATVTIEKDVPLSEAVGRPSIWAQRMPIRLLEEVGDSFHVPDDGKSNFVHRARSALSSIIKNHPEFYGRRAFTCRPVDDGVRVWRTK